MKTTFKLVAFLLTITLLSCNANLNLNDGVEGSGNVITEKRTINESFDKISASTGVTVIVEQGSPNDVEVETDDNLMQYVITKVENGTLIVKIEGNINTMSSIDVRVRMSSIVGLESTSGSRITSKNTLKGSTIAVKSSSGSNITVAGKALKLETASSSGSEIDADELAANDVFSQSSSGSSTTVKPIVKLDAKASSGSSIDYVQAPKTITKEETSGGSVDKE